MTRFMLAAALAVYLAIAVMPVAAGGGSEPIRPAGKSADSDASSDDAGKGREIELLQMKPIIVQLPGPGGLRRNVAFTLTLELAGTNIRDQVIAKRPKLRARIFEAWASPPLTRTGEENFDPEVVRRRTQHATDKLFGEGVVVGVLIEEIREVRIP